jgi:aquaporin Z
MALVTSLTIKLIAEFFGSFLLMLSVLASGGNFLVIGATLGVIVFLIGGISGSSVNPAISAGLWYNGTLSSSMFGLYTLVELLGGIAAAYSYKIVS